MKRWIHASTQVSVDIDKLISILKEVIPKVLSSKQNMLAENHCKVKYNPKNMKLEGMRHGSYADDINLGNNVIVVERTGSEDSYNNTGYCNAKISYAIEDMLKGSFPNSNVHMFYNTPDTGTTTEPQYFLNVTFLNEDNSSPSVNKVTDAVKSEWASPYAIEDMDPEDLYDRYLAGPEDQVNNELQIFPEPSTQGGMGSVYIYDESGKDRFSDVSIDYGDWCDKEFEMASSSENAEDYKKKYKSWIKKVCGI